MNVLDNVETGNGDNERGNDGDESGDGSDENEEWSFDLMSATACGATADGRETR